MLHHIEILGEKAQHMLVYIEGQIKAIEITTPTDVQLSIYTTTMYNYYKADMI